MLKPLSGYKIDVAIEIGAKKNKRPLPSSASSTRESVTSTRESLSSARAHDSTDTLTDTSLSSNRERNAVPTASSETICEDTEGSPVPTATSTNEQSSASTSTNEQSSASKKECPVASPPPGVTGGQKLMVMRHSERVDRIFPSWWRLANATGVYRPYDLNQPLVVPKRARFEDFKTDTCLTEMGNTMAQMVGRGLRVTNALPTHVYASPALRSIQTAVQLLRACKSSVRIRVEPGLFEFMAWYDNLPAFLSNEELLAAGYPVDASYNPMVTNDQLVQDYKNETVTDSLERQTRCLDSISALCPENASIIVVSHAPVHECMRALLGNISRPITAVTREDMERLGNAYPYCSITAAQKKEGHWTRCKAPLPPVSYLEFNSRVNEKWFERRSMTEATSEQLLYKVLSSTPNEEEPPHLKLIDAE